MDPNVFALRRLIGEGWLGRAIGNPDHPDMLVYTRYAPGIVDTLTVRDMDDAIATRRIMRELTIAIHGGVTDLVDAVLDWPTEVADS